MLSSSGTTWNSASTARVVHRQLGEHRRRHLLRVAGDDGRVGAAQRSDRVRDGDLRGLVEDHQVEAHRPRRHEPGQRVRAHQHARRDRADHLAVLLDQPPHAQPAARTPDLPLRAHRPCRRTRRAGRAAGPAAPPAAPWSATTAAAPTRRRTARTVRSCRSTSNDPNPAASHRSASDAAASPRSSASGPSSGATAPVSSAQRASARASPSGASASLASTHRPSAAPLGRSAERSADVAPPTSATTPGPGRTAPRPPTTRRYA